MLFQTWKPRYGYNRGNDNTKDWLIEIPDNKDPNVDYFNERNEAKRERVAKNQVQRLQNVKRQFNEMNKGNNRDGFNRPFNGRNQLKGANAIPLGVGTDSRMRSKSEVSLFNMFTDSY